MIPNSRPKIYCFQEKEAAESVVHCSSLKASNEALKLHVPAPAANNFAGTSLKRKEPVDDDFSTTDISKDLLTEAQELPSARSSLVQENKRIKLSHELLTSDTSIVNSSGAKPRSSFHVLAKQDRNKNESRLSHSLHSASFNDTTLKMMKVVSSYRPNSTLRGSQIERSFSQRQDKVFLVSCYYVLQVLISYPSCRTWLTAYET